MKPKPSSTIRLELFSDGVFAIAIMLLVMEIKLPSHMDLQRMGGPWSALAQQWRDYVGCTLTFAIMGVLWANHHAMFEQIRRVDRWLLLSNMFLMMGVGFLPYATVVLAENLGDARAQTSATLFYGATLIFCSFAYNALWWSAAWRRRLVANHLDMIGVRTISRRNAASLAGTMVATATAFANVWLSLAIHLGLAFWNATIEHPEPDADTGPAE